MSTVPQIEDYKEHLAVLLATFRPRPESGRLTGVTRAKNLRMNLETRLTFPLVSLAGLLRQ